VKGSDRKNPVLIQGEDINGTVEDEDISKNLFGGEVEGIDDGGGMLFSHLSSLKKKTGGNKIEGAGGN